MQEIQTGAAPGCVVLPGNVPSLGCLAIVVSNIINVAFLFLGAACIIFLLYGALLFILSRGDQKAVQKAKGTFTYAIIGTVLVLSTYLILNTFAYILGFPNMFTSFSFFIP